MSRKGVSAEEKRKRLEKVFHDTGEFYQLKELEKIGPQKGIVAQSVKDVLMSLVDDGLVTMDKIGTSNYFWSFQSDTAQKKKAALEEMKKKLEHEEKRNHQLTEQLQTLQEGREASEERDAILENLKEAQRIHGELTQALQEYKDNDPAVVEAKQKAIKTAKEAANRWTENIWALQSYCVNKFNMDRKLFNETFGISDDFDTIP
ncbi:meiotic nuclear division protein 1 [Radiomyces spectabilis]|uniref:meiotic nuclear division protein 1 n=1 Tax=Radiomyces spectabilis TaxID=64574 RepID=UPI00222096DA|nr:meiotic nuclear division protein 1 [Radiomyces spectabilis]KAI8379233.1 meiotic nuclear division protein 1 [Radiomyces spectabilis]